MILMAFDFLGTFRRDQIEALFAFADDQLEDFDQRLEYLRINIERVGWLSIERDDESGEVLSYDITPSDSLLAKYVRTFHYYGGTMGDLRIRSRGDWLSFTKGEATLDDAEFQGGKVQGTDADDDLYETSSLRRDDAIEAETVKRVKDWMIPSIVAKREEWEFRIKRCVDLTDQYLEELILLVRRHSGAETLDDLKDQINYYLESDEFVGAGRVDPLQRQSHLEDNE